MPWGTLIMGCPGGTAGVVASMGHGFLGYSHRGFPGLMAEAEGGMG